MEKTILTTNGKLKNGQVLIYENGKVGSADLRFLLPELEEFRKIMADQAEKIALLEKQVKELRGED